MQRSLIIGLLSALLLVVFALQNSDPVVLDFIIGNPVEETPLSLVLLVTIIIGIFVGLLLSYPTLKKLKTNISDNNAEITKLTNILEEYKKEYGIHKNKNEEKKQEEKPEEK
ncbi:MAG: LapA family protein [Bacteroidales bacterium]|nr:LapA family protein [Bacteroidales bacterium]